MARYKSKRQSAGANGSSSSGASQEYDWNVKARLLEVLHEERSSASEGDTTIEWDKEDLPEDGEALSPAQVNKFSLNHGDILRFGDYRFSQTFIVYRTPGGKYKLIENPDESGSGYLTIPAEILQNVTDAVEKYKDVLESSSATVVHVSRDDKFVKDQLGEEDIPDTWDIAVSYTSDEIEVVCITQGDSTWECSEWDSASLEDIQTFFSGADQPNTKLVVKIDLKGDKFTEYKTKHATKKKSLAWIKAFAKLPKTWKIEKGATGMGSTHYRTEWRCVGPTEEKDATKTSIEEFFQGFEIAVEEQKV